MGRKRTAAVGYLRVSGLSQADKGGFERQHRTVQDFAKREGYELQRVYEETHSGADEDRPLFGEMVADLANNCCRIVIVESMDRFARDMAGQCAGHVACPDSCLPAPPDPQIESCCFWATPVWVRGWRSLRS